MPFIKFQKIQIFSEALFTTAKLCKSPKCPPTHEWIKKGGIYAPNGIKRRNPIIYHNTDELGGHYVKLNKPNTDKLLHDFLYTKYLK